MRFSARAMAFLVHNINSHAISNLHIQAMKTVFFSPVQRGEASNSAVSFQLYLVEKGKALSDWFGKRSGSHKPKFHVLFSKKRAGNETTYFELYQGQDLTETKSALEALRISLEPLLHSAAIDITSELLSELVLPSPKPVTELPSVLLKVAQQNGRSSGIDAEQFLRQMFGKLTLLHLLCKKGDDESLKAFLERGADIQTTDHHGGTPLHIAAKHSFKCLKQLLVHIEEKLTRAQRIDFLNRSNHIGHSSLHVACGKGNADAVEALVKAGAKLAIPAVKDSMSYPLHFAAQYNRHECISAISRKYGYLNPDPHDAEKEEDKRRGLNSPDASGDTPLIIAVKNQHVKSALALLLEFADPNCPNPSSLDSPLHVAARECDITLVQLLFVFGADAAPKNRSGKTPLEEAKEAKPHPQKEQCIQAIETVIRYQEEDTARSVQHTEVKCRADDMVFLLSLDGGGIRGLILAQILLAVEERMKRLDPHYRHLSTYFDWIAGTSTGAFLTLGFTKYKANAAKCRKLYFTFKNKALAGCRVYAASDIDASLKDAYAHLDVMADIKGVKVIVTSCLADHLPPELHLICNYGEARNGQLPPSRRLIWEAARASSAAPTYFPAFDKKFLDGGVMANNPTLEAMSEIFSEAKKEGHKVTIGCVLSLGTGVVKPTPVKEVSVVTPHSPSDLLHDIEAIKNLIELLIDQSTLSAGMEITQARAWCDSMAIPYFRFSPPIDNIELNETDDTKLIKMLFDTLVYTLENRDEIDKLAKLLLTKVN